MDALFPLPAPFDGLSLNTVLITACITLIVFAILLVKLLTTLIKSTARLVATLVVIGGGGTLGAGWLHHLLGQ